MFSGVENGILLCRWTCVDSKERLRVEIITKLVKSLIKREVESYERLTEKPKHLYHRTSRDGGDPGTEAFFSN